MNLDKLMGLSGIGLEIGLQAVSIQELRAAVISMKAEITSLESTAAGLRAQKASLSKGGFGDYFENEYLDTATKEALLGELRSLSAKKTSLLKEISSTSLDIRNFKSKLETSEAKHTKEKKGEVKLRRKGKNSSSGMHNEISAMMEKIPAENRAKFRDLGSDSAYECALLTNEDGFSPDEAYELVQDYSPSERKKERKRRMEGRAVDENEFNGFNLQEKEKRTKKKQTSMFDTSVIDRRNKREAKAAAKAKAIADRWGDELELT